MTISDLLLHIQADLILFCLAVGLLLFWAGLWMVHLIGICYGKWLLYRKKPDSGLPREVPLPGVSILKPLVGIDANIYSNLESFFTQAYPTFEILFCLHTETDPALMIVRSLMNKYPDVDARIFIGGEHVGVNPKINNLMPGYRAAKYDLVLISDSGLRMKEDTLLDMVETMSDKVGIVTQLPFTCDRKGFAATVEKIYFGTQHARIYLSADLFHFICSTGMSSLLRKTVLDELGGIGAFSKYIAEDYFFARSIVAKGYKAAISSQPAWQNSGSCSLSALHERTCRWIKLRVAMLPHTMILEPMQECMLLGAVASWAVNFLLGWNSLIFFLIHCLVWMLLDYLMLNVVQNAPLMFGKFEFVISWIYRELTTLPVFVSAVWNPWIKWKTGGVIRLKWGGFAEEIKSAK